MKTQDKKIKCPLCNMENRPYLNENHRLWYFCHYCGIQTPLFRVKKIYNELNNK